MSLLSIVIPVYNVEKYIERTLNSIYSQQVDEKEFEVVVVNDGTPDNSMEIVEKYALRYSNLHIINQPNGGLSSARNIGLLNAGGDYIWFVDSDDWLTEDSLSGILNYLHNDSSLDVITMPLIWYFEDTGEQRLDYSIANDLKISGRDYLRQERIQGAVPRNIIRKSILIDNGLHFYIGILHEDSVFCPQLYYLSQNILIIKKSYYYYRQRTSGSIMHSLKIRSAYDLLKGHQELINFMDKKVVKEDISWFRPFVFLLIEAAFRFTSHLSKSQEFKDFVNSSYRYRVNEYVHCKQYLAQPIKRLKFYLLTYQPILALNLFDIKKRLQKLSR